LIDDGWIAGWVDKETNNDVVPALLTPAMTASARLSATGSALPRLDRR
jgi:hypothetical protein